MCNRCAADSQRLKMEFCACRIVSSVRLQGTVKKMTRRREARTQKVLGMAADSTPIPPSKIYPHCLRFKRLYRDPLLETPFDSPAAKIFDDRDPHFVVSFFEGQDHIVIAKSLHRPSAIPNTRPPFALHRSRGVATSHRHRPSGCHSGNGRRAAYLLASPRAEGAVACATH